MECLAAVPEAFQGQRPAGKWVQATLAAVGGKGGGQARLDLVVLRHSLAPRAFAQGAARATEGEALKAAAEAAKQF